MAELNLCYSKKAHKDMFATALLDGKLSPGRPLYLSLSTYSTNTRTKKHSIFFFFFALLINYS